MIEITIEKVANYNFFQFLFYGMTGLEDLKLLRICFQIVFKNINIHHLIWHLHNDYSLI